MMMRHVSFACSGSSPFEYFTATSAHGEVSKRWEWRDDVRTVFGMATDVHTVTRRTKPACARHAPISHPAGNGQVYAITTAETTNSASDVQKKRAARAR